MVESSYAFLRDTSVKVKLEDLSMNSSGGAVKSSAWTTISDVIKNIFEITLLSKNIFGYLFSVLM